MVPLKESKVRIMCWWSSGRRALSVMMFPSRSSVSVSTPSLSVARYLLIPFMRRGTSFVARLRKRGNTPVARGSSVPPCPTFFTFKIFCTLLTTWYEVHPLGLSTMSIPFIRTTYCFRYYSTIQPSILLIVTFDCIITVHAPEERVDFLSVVERVIVFEDNIRYRTHPEPLSQLPFDKVCNTL